MNSGITRTASARKSRSSARISEEKTTSWDQKKWPASGTTAVELAFIVADFFHQLSLLQRRFAEDMSSLVQTFQERTRTFAKRCPEDCSCVQRAWVALLNNCSATNQETVELSNVMENSISPQLEEIGKYRKELLTEVMSYHNTFIRELEDTEKELVKVQDDYRSSWLNMKTVDNKDLTNQYTVQYYNSHNDYVLQLAGTNHTETTICNATLNKTISDLEAIQCDIQEAIAFSLNRYARFFQTQLLEQTNRLDALISSTKKSNHLQASLDLSVLTQKVPSAESKIFEFEIMDSDNKDVVNGKNKLILNSATEAALRQKHTQLTQKVKEQEVSVSTSRDTLAQLRKLLESHKSTEKAAAIAKILSDIHRVKNDIRRQEVSLGLHRTQLLLFPPDWFNSSNSLTNGHPSSGNQANNSAPSSHLLQEYNFIKTTLCFQCKTPLKGLMKQGLRCKVCKVSVHHKCQENLTDCSTLAQEFGKSGKASSKKIFRRQNSVQDIRVSLADKRKFLRRQKSSSALEIPEDTLREREDGTRPCVTVDPVYETIKCAASLSSLSHSSSESRPASNTSSGITPERAAAAAATTKDEEDAFLLPPNNATTTSSMSKSAPHRRLRMSSLDRFSTSHNFSSNNSSDLLHTNILTSLSFRHDSPSHADERRKILQQSGKSVSLDNEKGPREDERRLMAPSVASAASLDANRSRQSTSQFVVLYDFEGMLRDDLTLRTGEVIRVLSGRNAEWWKGEVDGRIGFFPSFCVTPIYANESVMRVISGIRASEEHVDGINLRKHQIVVKSGTDNGGWVKVRTALKSGYYPVNCLQTLVSQQ